MAVNTDGKTQQPSSALEASATKGVASDRNMTDAKEAEPGHYYENKTQSKGFVEQLHAPQPSDRAHWGSRWNAINPVDTNSIRNLGNVAEAAYAQWEKDYVPQGLEDYANSRAELQRAIDSGQISDAEAVHIRNRLRTEAWNKYGLSKHSSEILERYERNMSGHNDAEKQMDSWVASAEAIKKNGEEMGFGQGPSIFSPEFKSWADQVKEHQMTRTLAEAATNRLTEASKNTELTGHEQVNTVMDNLPDLLKPTLQSIDSLAKKAGKFDENTIGQMMAYVDKAEVELKTQFPRASVSPYWKSTISDSFNIMRNTVQALAKCTNYEDTKRLLTTLQQRLGIVNLKQSIEEKSIDIGIKKIQLKGAQAMDNDLVNGKLPPDALSSVKAIHDGKGSPKDVANTISLDTSNVSSDTQDFLDYSVFSAMGGNWGLLYDPQVAYALSEKPDVEKSVSKLPEPVKYNLRGATSDSLSKMKSTWDQVGTIKGTDGKRYHLADCLEVSTSKNGLTVAPKKGYEKNSVVKSAGLQATKLYNNMLKVHAGCAGGTCDWSKLHKDTAFLSTLESSLGEFGLHYKGGKKGL